jgi:hypothetical protein
MHTKPISAAARIDGDLIAGRNCAFARALVLLLLPIGYLT